MAKILVIDDDQAILDGMKVGLESLGHHVWTTAEGNISVMAVRAKKIDLVVTDIMMPDFNGIEVITTIRKEFPYIKIIAITGRDFIENFSYLEMAKNLGADEALNKPVKLSAIAKLIEKWGL